MASAQFVESIKLGREWSGNVGNWIGLAMVEARRDNVEEARSWLAKAEQWIEEQGRDSEVHITSRPV